MSRRDANNAHCPLCGARVSAAELLDTCGELIAEELGVLAGRCPHCQGYLEMRPGQDRLEIGYTGGPGGSRFETALTLPFPGLTVAHDVAAGDLRVSAADRTWIFEPAE